ncbi:hypothetical protein BV394_04900 [Brevirhabdus pacifica]|uniref:Uncharacterized protein n=1 Tax=Brevirhabdus pacifica TaxID=1267768 RepID=A0A1U7DGK8_9RHOB|nr:hypothetical protein [Brevirhabdus pacifica]APX89134.1 hypothetical protein BV394_04900 [Brevirhabdus pacifica]OWU76807.1 hypothetical protein ATO5_11390 [Loktanella sp. 22II-4b]PJJ86274.1 rod shape-determining protein MreD [Brevirhabdus pacifica]
MADPRQNRRWVYRFAFLGLTVVILYLRLLPLDSGPKVLAGPDLLLCLALVWTARNPEYVPVALIGGVFLLTDFLLMRPPGLWTALVILGTEFMRSRTGRGIEMTATLEWALASVTIAGIILANRVVLAIAAVPIPPLINDLMFIAVTVIAYPAVLAFSHYVFGVRRSLVRENRNP